MRLPFQQQVESTLYTMYALTRAGFVRAERPDTLARLAHILMRWGMTPAAGSAAAATRFQNETAIIDDLADLPAGETHRLLTANANLTQDHGAVLAVGIQNLAR